MCCVFSDQFKRCSAHPRLKKSNLNNDDLSNYRPVSHLSFFTKHTERVVKLRLIDYLSTNNLLKSFQSAYVRHHTTEPTLFSVLDHITKAILVINKSLVVCFLTCLLLLILDLNHSSLLEHRSSALIFLPLLSLSLSLSLCL